MYVLRTLGAFAIMGLATQTLAAPQPIEPSTALDKRITFNDVEQFTKNFFTSFFKRDLEVRSTTQASAQSSQSSTEVMNNALSHLNHTVAVIKASGLTNSSAALLSSSLNHMKDTISSKLNPEEKAAFQAAAKNFAIPAPAHSKRDAKKDGTLAGDAASFFQHAWSLLKGAGGLLEGAAEEAKRDVAVTEKRDAAKDGTIAGDAASFFQHVASIFSGLFESVE